MERLDIVPGISQMLHRTSLPGRSHIRLAFVKPESISSIPCGEHAAEHDSSMSLNAKAVEPVRLISAYRLQLIPYRYRIPTKKW